MTQFYATSVASIKGRIGLFRFTNQCWTPTKFLVHMVDFMTIILCYNSFVRIQGYRPPNCHHDLLMHVQFIMAFNASLWSNRCAEHWNIFVDVEDRLIISCHVTIRSRNASVLLRNSCGIHLSSFFTFLIYFKCSATVLSRIP